MRPLNERAPNLPWVELAHLPTPIQRLNWSGSSAATVWAKRDDLTSPAYGGNKIRKLEYLLGRALARGDRAVLTFGAMGSNHVLATTRFCAQLGLDCVAVMSRQVMTSYLPANLAAVIRSGAVLHSCPKFSGVADAAKEAAQAYFDRHGSKPMLIPPGGSSDIGALGFVNAAFELDQQIKQGVLPEPDRIYIALGTMGSVVGLGLGLAALGRKTEIVAVKVVHDSVADPDTMRTLWEKANDTLCREISGFPLIDISAAHLTVREEFFGSGYALPTDEASVAVDSARRAGLRLETTYTGKTLAALARDATNVAEDQHYLFWDTANSRPLAPAAGVNTDGIDPEIVEYLRPA